MLSPKKKGTKVAPYYLLEVPPGEERVVKMRLTDAECQPKGDPFGVEFDEVFDAREKEADDFYDQIMSKNLGPEQRNISRQAYAGTQLRNITGEEGEGERGRAKEGEGERRKGRESEGKGWGQRNSG